MVWGEFGMDRDMGPAARVLLDEYDRRCRMFGPHSREVQAFSATELGFEHNLGLLHKAYQTRALRLVRHGVIEHEYYLERCLLEAVGSSILQRGVVMCSSVVGDAMVEQMYARIFGNELRVHVPEPVLVPELRIHPASTVGMGLLSQETQLCDDPGVGLQAGFCYLALVEPQYVDEARVVLGPEPTLRRLVQFGGAGKFLPESGLSQLYIRQVGGGYHVDNKFGQPFSKVLEKVQSDPDANGWFIGGDSLYLGQYGVGADAGEVLCDWLSSIVGKPVKLKDDTLALVTSSAALLDPGGKKRLRSLEAVGDSALSMMIARDNYFRGESVERFQNLRSFVTSNKVLSERFVEKVPPDAVRFVGGVNPATGIVGAKALESILGAVWLELGDAVVSQVLQALDLLDFPLRVTGSFVER